MYRLFVAVDLPESVKDSIKNICCGLPDARWVNVNQLHLTLRFIGDADDVLFSNIKKSLSEITEPAFSIRLNGVGCFPPKKNPRVLWVGMEKCDELVSLATSVESNLVEKCGIEPEGRSFSPHITIARFRETRPRGVADFLERHSSFQSDLFPVEAFHLYSSTLKPSGAEHRQERSYPLPWK